MDIPLDEVIYFDLISSSSTGAAVDADSTPTFEVFEEATDTDVGVGGNLTKRTGKTGNYRGSFTASAANGFEVGKWYSVIGYATIGGIACKGVAIRFRIVAAEAIAGKPKVDVDAVAGTSQTAGDVVALVNTLTAYVDTEVAAILAAVDTEVAAIKAKTDQLTFTSSTYVQADVINWKTATAPAMAGDAFARLGAPAGASIAADIAAVSALISALNNLSQANVRSAVGLGSANLDTQLGTISGYLDTEIAAILAAVDTEILAIKAKTDNLPSDPADQSILAAAIDAVPLAVWDFDLSGPAFSVFSAGAVLLRVGARVALTGTVDASPAPSASGFTATLSQAMATGSIDDALLQFSSGTLIHQSKPISAGTAGTGTKMAFTFDEAFTTAPTAGDAIQVVVSHIHPISQIADGVRSELAVELARLDAAVSTRASQTSVDTIGGYLDTEIAAILAAVDTEVAAIKAKTDQLAFTNSGKVDASIQAASDFVTAAANKLADIMARRTTANIEASAFGDTIGLGSLYSVIQQLQKSGPASGATFPIYKSDGTTLLGNLTLSFDAAAEPVTGVE